jgi:hypothetical protein
MTPCGRLVPDAGSSPGSPKALSRRQHVEAECPSCTRVPAQPRRAASAGAIISLSYSEREGHFVPITEIMSVVNHTHRAVHLENTENPNDTVRVPPLQSRGATIWVPWATNADEFLQHHLRVIFVEEVPPVWAIWQAAFEDGDNVRYAKLNQFEFPGTWISGEHKAGGKRALHIHDDHLALDAAHPHIQLEPVKTLRRGSCPSR